MWAGASGGGVWRTEDALAATPRWRNVSGAFEQNSVGTLTADPNDPTGNTIYLGTGEGNRCTSGCESGVGIYRTTDGGNHWKKLADACVDSVDGNEIIPLGLAAWIDAAHDHQLVADQPGVFASRDNGPYDACEHHDGFRAQGSRCRVRSRFGDQGTVFGVP